MPRALSRVLLLVFFAAFTACKTRPIPAFEPIQVPPGLSAQKVELAIFAGILNKPPPADFDPTGPPLTDEQFRKLLWDYFLRDARGRSWFPESTGPGIVYAAVNARSHYLRVALTFNESVIETQIVASENLMQGEGKIHNRALKWIAQLHEHIRRELGRLSASGRGGT